MNKKRGLGKGLADIGLNELLSDMTASVVATTPPSETAVPAAATASVNEQLRMLPIDLIGSGRYQPRRVFDETDLQELADSIKAQGVIQPIIVRKLAGDQFEIIAGERRWRAAQMAGLEIMPAIVRDMSDETAMAVALIENVQRRDLNAIEEAAGLQRLIDEFQLTHQEIATAIGKSRTNVTNLLRLLKLNPDVRTLVEQGKLEMGHARALLALTDLQQSQVAKQVADNQLSVRATEQLIHQIKMRGRLAPTSKSKLDPNITSLQHQLADTLGAKVAIQHTAKGKGKLVIHYNSVDELEGILSHIE